MDLTLVLTGVGVGVNVIALLFVALQIVLARRQLQAGQNQQVLEDKRRKKQATIDSYMLTVDKVAAWREELPPDWDANAIDTFLKEMTESNDAARFRVVGNYLSYFEAMAVAVRSGVYDLETLIAISGSRIVLIGAGYHQFFLLRRSQHGIAAAYENLEWLTQRILRITGGDYAVGSGGWWLDEQSHAIQKSREPATQ